MKIDDIHSRRLVFVGGRKVVARRGIGEPMGANNPCFVLYGIKGVYNYGCEAIVRGTEILLRERWPDARITYVTSRFYDDSRRLEGTRVNIHALKGYKWYEPKRVLRKGARMLGLPWDPLMEKMDYLEQADMVLSIGGDLYTMAADGLGYSRRLIQFGEIVLRKGKKFVVWGASIGPFETNPQAREAYREHLRRVDLITAREPQTIEYLARLGITRNVVPCADPAFMVNTIMNTSKTNHGRLRIGVNYSPLSVSYHLGSGGQAEILGEKQAMVLCTMMEKYDAEVTLIPHVVCEENPYDDDRRYLESILNRMPKGLLERVHFVGHDPGFIELRNVLDQCDIVIAARMHCGINAISLGIPTILIAYSSKSVGMAQYVYGHSDWVVPVEQTAKKKLIQVVERMIQEREMVRRKLRERLPGIQEDARNACIALDRVLATGRAV